MTAAIGLFLLRLIRSALPERVRLLIAPRPKLLA